MSVDDGFSVVKTANLLQSAKQRGIVDTTMGGLDAHERHGVATSINQARERFSRVHTPKEPPPSVAAFEFEGAFYFGEDAKGTLTEKTPPPTEPES